MAFGGVLKADMRRMLRGRNIYVTLAGTMLITLVGMVPEIWAYRAEVSVFYLAYQHTLSNQFFLLMTMLQYCLLLLQMEVLFLMPFLSY